MEQQYEKLKNLLDDNNTSDETKEAIRKILEDEQKLHERLAKELEQIIKK